METLEVNGFTWNVDKTIMALSSSLFNDSNKMYYEPFLPLTDMVNFADMTWDFSESKKYHEDKRDYIYNFNDITTLSYRIFTKRLVLRELYNNDNRYTSVARILPEVKKFIHYLEKEVFIFEPNLINKKVVKDFIDIKCGHLKGRTKKSAVFGGLKKFFMEIEKEVDDFFLSRFENLLHVDKRDYRAEIEAGKTPNIPRILFNRIIQVALKEINDTRYDDYVTVQELASKMRVSDTTIRKKIKSNFYDGVVKVGDRNKKTYLIPKEYMHNNTKFFNKTERERVTEEFIKNPPPSIEDRMIACMLLILSQTGMRIGEFLLLELNRLKEIKILKGEKTAYSLEFFTYKTSPSKDGKWTETFMSDIAVKAYKTLEDLTKNRRNNGQNALYISTKGDFYLKNQVRNHFKKFFFKHRNVLGFETLNKDQLEQLPKWIISESDVNSRFKSIQEHHIGKIIYKVNPHQFRVAVANFLKNKGVPLQWIRSHMNHLEEDMTKHYFRDEKQVRTALISRASNDGSSLEINPINIADNEIKKELVDPSFQEAYETINKFLKKKKLNIFKDLDTIIELLVESPINETDLGYCINAIGKICERQERLATLERWYYVKPDIPDITYIDFTYRRLLDKLKLVEHNQILASKNPKYSRQFEVEQKGLGKFYYNKFLPELQHLKEMLLKHGSQSICSQYPTLEDIISNIDTIELEVKECLMKFKLMK